MAPEIAILPPWRSHCRKGTLCTLKRQDLEIPLFGMVDHVQVLLYICCVIAGRCALKIVRVPHAGTKQLITSKHKAQRAHSCLRLAPGWKRDFKALNF